MMCKVVLLFNGKFGYITTVKSKSKYEAIGVAMGFLKNLGINDIKVIHCEFV